MRAAFNRRESTPEQNVKKCNQMFPLRTGSAENSQDKWVHKAPRREKSTISLGNRSWRLTLLRGDLWRTAKGHHSWYREHLAPHREASWHYFSFADVEFRNLRQREPVICCRTRQNWRSVVLLHYLLMLPFSASSSQLHWSEKYLWELKTRTEVKDNFSDVSYRISPKVILGIKLHSWPQGWHLKYILCEF